MLSSRWCAFVRIWSTFSCCSFSMCTLTSTECCSFSYSYLLLSSISLSLWIASSACLCSAILYAFRICCFLSSAYIVFYSKTFCISCDLAIDRKDMSLLSRSLAFSKVCLFSSALLSLSSNSFLCLKTAISATFLVCSIFAYVCILFVVAALYLSN